MDTSLTTFDGYPRADLDVAQSIPLPPRTLKFLTEPSPNNESTDNTYQK
jgi:hypothetical protein